MSTLSLQSSHEECAWTRCYVRKTSELHLRPSARGLYFEPTSEDLPYSHEHTESGYVSWRTRKIAIAKSFESIMNVTYCYIKHSMQMCDLAAQCFTLLGSMRRPTVTQHCAYQSQCPTTPAFSVRVVPHMVEAMRPKQTAFAAWLAHEEPRMTPHAHTKLSSIPPSALTHRAYIHSSHYNFSVAIVEHAVY